MAKFTIIQGKEFVGYFIVKEPSSTTPVDMTGSTSTFTMGLIDGSCTAITDKVMELVDPLNGKIKVTLTAEDTSDLVGEVGFREDGNPLVATYKAHIEITHPTLGKIFVRIQQIYIEVPGSACPVS